MKKIISIIALVFSFFFGSVAHAQTHNTQDVIDMVVYDNKAHEYIALTKDNGNGYWSLDLFHSNKLDQSLLDSLYEYLKGKHVTITYDDQESSNTEDWFVEMWEIN
jgi:hypothetical protein